jgi:hypothetical protein
MVQSDVIDTQNWHGSFKWHWAVFSIAALVFATASWHAAHVAPLPPEPLSAIKPEGNAHWYFVIRFPEAPSDAQGTKIAQIRTAEWLHALIQEGFHPMLFSDIATRLKDGVGIPDKAVVIVFQPGTKHTDEALEPLLARTKSPAVWLTDRTAMRKSDLRYVHEHRASLMIQSGWWDVIDSKNPLWSSGTGPSALNWNTTSDHINRLNVNPGWSGQELVNRLLAEMPLQGRMQLTLRPVRGRLTGVLSAKIEDAANPFHLETPLGKHSTTVGWLGTKGFPNATIDFDVPSRVGDFIITLRSDPARDERVRIGYGDGFISVDERIQGQDKRLATLPWVSQGLHPPIHGALTLVGNRLELTRPGNSPIQVTLDHADSHSAGIVQLTVYDKIRGAAVADSIRLVITPLAS